MGWFKSAAKSIEHAGKKALDSAESAGKTVGKGVTSAGKTVEKGVVSATKTVGKGLEDAGKAVSDGVTTAGKAIEKETVHSAESVEKSVTTAADTLANTSVSAFNSAVNEGEKEFNAVKKDLQKALEAGEAAILSHLAQSKIEELEPIIDDLRGAWGTIRSDMSSEFETLKSEAFSKHISGAGHEAIGAIAKHPHMARVLGKFAAKSYLSFGFEFGASAAYGVGVEAALGVCAGLPNVTDIRGYGSVGGSVGASVGGEVDESLVVNLSSPEDSGGGYIAVIFSLEAEVGGTVVVSFNLPDFSMGGVSIGLGEGAEVSVAVGGGYTFVF